MSFPEEHARLSGAITALPGSPRAAERARSLTRRATSLYLRTADPSWLDYVASIESALEGVSGRARPSVVKFDRWLEQHLDETLMAARRSSDPRVLGTAARAAARMGLWRAIRRGWPGRARHHMRRLLDDAQARWEHGHTSLDARRRKAAQRAGKELISLKALERELLPENRKGNHDISSTCDPI